MIKKLDSIEYV